MANRTLPVIRPLATLGHAEQRLLAWSADGAEREILRVRGKDPAPLTRAIEELAQGGEARHGAIIDVAFCEWVDSSSLGVWVSWLRILEKGGGRLAVCRANDRILNVLRVSQLDQVFLVCATLGEAALALLGPADPA